ncbi:hypothetical protein B0H14DRAFT_2535153 [Mycena olivaceomarginata]|nr:hypothetical protein B0H14DRAFT_2535153 [Mycena olivaceomarginata]
MSSPEQAYLDLLKAGGKTSEDVATKIFDQLKPIEPSFLIGEWEGGDFDTGHPATEALKAIKWRGKIFHSEEDVEPIIVSGEGGKRTALVEYGRGRIREVKFRDVVSASLVYDDRPVIDHFRYVNENTVAGMMDIKGAPPGYYFHLTRYHAIHSKL